MDVCCHFCALAITPWRLFNRLAKPLGRHMNDEMNPATDARGTVTMLSRREETALSSVPRKQNTVAARQHWASSAPTRLHTARDVRFTVTIPVALFNFAAVSCGTFCVRRNRTLAAIATTALYY
jgi:hypothetical protein